MLLIYTNKQTNRLGYTFKLVFENLLGMDYAVTTDKQYFIDYNGAKLSYGEDKICDELYIRTANDLLFDATIYSIEISYFNDKGTPKIFRNYDDDNLGFDIFAATFYMVSRYEEYLPFIRDSHLRFGYKDSIAYKKSFLDKPVVNMWAEELRKFLQQKYPDIQIKKREFNFINTIDIDQAWCYKGKSLYRNIGGVLRDIKQKDWQSIKTRIRVLLSLEKDPWRSYDFIINELKRHKLNTIFFVLYTFYDKWDKNVNVYNKDFQLLIKRLGDYGEIGLHPSYYSMENPSEIDMSKRLLKAAIHKEIVLSRFHYLRFTLPESYRNLLEYGIKEDYSMGYSDCIGFRAGICTPYNFYDLDRDCETNLLLHPFEIMDVAMKNALNFDVDKAKEHIGVIIDNIKNVGGEFVSVWHNESLSDYGQWQGWREVYDWQIKQLKTDK